MIKLVKIDNKFNSTDALINIIPLEDFRQHYYGDYAWEQKIECM